MGFASAVADVRRDTRDFEDSRWARVVARGGYAGQGLLLGTIGVLALLVAVQRHILSTDATNAFAVLGSAPGGVVVLVAIVIGEYTLALWLIGAGIVRSGRSLNDWRQRSIVWGRAVAYLVVGTIALRVVFGARDDGGAAERSSSKHLLDAPGGAVVLGLIGAVIVIAGVSFVWLGLSCRFVKTIVPPERIAVRRLVVVVGVIGYVARGVTLTLVGVLVVVAAVTLDAATAAGLGSVLGVAITSVAGRIALALVALGWIAAGLYTIARAALARFGSS